MSENKKSEILKQLEKSYSEPGDLSIGEIAKKTGMSDPTASTYCRILEAEGKIEVSRRVGKAVFYRLKK